MKGVTVATSTTFIDGRQILSQQLRALTLQGELFSACDILLITPSGPDVPPSTYVSAKEKVKVFSGLGFRVRSIMANRLAPQNWEGARHIFYIAQNPIRIDDLPASFRAAATNLDDVSPFPEFSGSSAVVEAVMRCIDGAGAPLAPCVVIGARGRVGGRVSLLLKARGVSVRGVDIGDDLGTGLGDATTVVAATGSPWLVRAEMLGPKCQLVLDVGYHYDEHTGQGRGDVSSECYSLPLTISPVPGGVGPLQVLTLVERAVARIQGATYVPWSLRLNG